MFIIITDDEVFYEITKKIICHYYTTLVLPAIQARKHIFGMFTKSDSDSCHGPDFYF